MVVIQMRVQELPSVIWTAYSLLSAHKLPKGFAFLLPRVANTAQAGQVASYC